MKKINHIDALQQSILLLEIKQADEEVMLKEQFMITYDSLKPINIIKRLFDDVTDLSDTKGNLIDTSLSILAGYLSKKIAFGSTKNPIKQILGGLIQTSVTNIVANNSDNIKSFGARIISLISKSK